MSFFGNISIVEKILFARHLAIMLKSGMPFSDAISTLKEQAESKKMEEVLDYCLEAVNQGESLGWALENFKNQFSSLFLNMIQLGEQSGSLISNLDYLAVQLRKTHELRSKVKSAMVYPAIVFFMTVLLSSGLAFFVFPKLVNFFETLDVKLPLPTRILMWVAQGSKQYGLYFLVGIVGIVIGARLLYRFDKVKFQIQRFYMHLPWIGPLVQKTNLAYFSRTLSSLLQAGVDIVEALEITSDAMGNLVYKKDIREARKRIQSGESLGSVLKEKGGHFPVVASHMIEVGEETGSLKETLLYLADFYEEDVDSATENLGEVLEPILLIIMGLAVGFVAIAIILPIYKITQGLQI